MKPIRFGLVGMLILGWISLTGCEDTRLSGVRTQVDPFTQQGDVNIDEFEQNGLHQVDQFEQTGFNQVDTFQQRLAAKVDILWVVDNSPTMEQEQDLLAANFDRFIQFISDSDVDYHIGVISTDMDDPSHSGKLREEGGARVISNNTPNPATVFGANIRVGTSGFGDEQGLYAAHQALSDPDLAEYNKDFLRQDAILALIFVSDENDNSRGTADYYKRFFNSVKDVGNEQSVVIAAVVAGKLGDVCSQDSDCPNGFKCLPDVGYYPQTEAGKRCQCSNNENCQSIHCPNNLCDYDYICNDLGHCQIDKEKTADQSCAARDGSRYAYLTQAAGGGGTTNSICADFGENLEKLGLTAAGLSRKFVLSKLPDPNTIVVRVDANGDGVWEFESNTPDPENGWRLDLSEPAIYFDGNYVPPPQADIQVEYSKVENEFLLSRVDFDRSTLVVSVDEDGEGPGGMVEKQEGQDWQYHSDINAVIFTNYLPPMGSLIEISYAEPICSFVLSKKVEALDNLLVEVDPGDGKWGRVYEDPENGWVYDAETQSLLFNGKYCPRHGEKMRVTYSDLDWLFSLSYVPLVETIEVRLDRDGEGGEEAQLVPKYDEDSGTAGWTYYGPEKQPPYENSISFEKFEKSDWPPLGSVITVAYQY